MTYRDELEAMRLKVEALEQENAELRRQMDKTDGTPRRPPDTPSTSLMTPVPFDDASVEQFVEELRTTFDTLGETTRDSDEVVWRSEAIEASLSRVGTQTRIRLHLSSPSVSAPVKIAGYASLASLVAIVLRFGLVVQALPVLGLVGWIAYQGMRRHRARTRTERRRFAVELAARIATRLAASPRSRVRVSDVAPAAPSEARANPATDAETEAGGAEDTSSEEAERDRADSAKAKTRSAG